MDYDFKVWWESEEDYSEYEVPVKITYFQPPQPAVIRADPNDSWEAQSAEIEYEVVDSSLKFLESDGKFDEDVYQKAMEIYYSSMDDPRY